MADKSFYKNYGPFSLYEIEKEFGCKCIGDKKLVINDVSPLATATRKNISFFNNKKYFKMFNESCAGAIVVEKKYMNNKENTNFLISSNPYFLFAQIVRKFYPDSISPNNFFTYKDKKKSFNNNVRISYNAFIHKTAKIGSDSTVGVNSFVGPGVEIGSGCEIADNVTIIYSKLRDNCKIFSGSRIGGEGFGFAIKDNKFLKIPQIGRVIINDNVEIGCNVTIDRGSSGDTLIDDNCMIDNMVHIGHNVVIGKNCIIAGMAGFSGSTKLGNNVMVGGQAGFSGHLNIGENSKIAAGSGVIKDVKANQSVGGYPAQPILDWHKSFIKIKKLIRDV